MKRLDGDAAASFSPLRPRLTGIAYRMLGSVAEAEDVVQDAYLRWHDTDRAAVRDPAAFLVRTVTRLCLDHLKSARVRRESYVGPWLPEPVFDPEADQPHEDVTLTLMMALERLSPLERAAFLLHDVFDLDFDEVAETLGRNAAACRQLCHRARDHVRAARPRFPVSRERGQEIAAAFFRASRNGDMAALQSLLAADATLYTDGGGKAPSALNPIFGRSRIARFFTGIARKLGHTNSPSPFVRVGTVSGLPGFVTIDPIGVLQVTALAIENDKITAVFTVRNPDKLHHIRSVTAAPGTLH